MPIPGVDSIQFHSTSVASNHSGTESSQKQSRSIDTLPFCLQMNIVRSYFTEVGVVIGVTMETVHCLSGVVIGVAVATIHCLFSIPADSSHRHLLPSSASQVLSSTLL